MDTDKVPGLLITGVSLPQSWSASEMDSLKSKRHKGDGIGNANAKTQPDPPPPLAHPQPKIRGRKPNTLLSDKLASFLKSMSILIGLAEFQSQVSWISSILYPGQLFKASLSESTVKGRNRVCCAKQRAMNQTLCGNRSSIE